MAFDFPAAPTIGQAYTPSQGITYVWTGQVWDRTAPQRGVFVMPAGLIMPFGGDVPPVGALVCNGQTFSRTFQKALFDIIGTKFGVGDGSTTANVPDLRGRTVIGLDTDRGGFANRVTNTGIGNPGINSKTMGATGGFDRFTVTAVNIPAHQHGGSGVSSYISNDHAHGFNVNTGGESVGHQHYVSGYVDAGGTHYHGMTYSPTKLNSTSGTSERVGGSRGAHDASTLDNGSHQHSMNFWAGGINVGHVHNAAGGTAGVNANHTHSYEFTSTSVGGGEAMPQVQPSIVLNYIIFTGATA